MQGADRSPGAAASLLSCPQPWLIGVIHLPALPAAPSATLPVSRIAEDAVRDARLLADAGFTAVLLENFNDRPFRASRVDAETVAAMAVVTAQVSRSIGIPVGVNVLRNDALSALGIAHASGASFLRVNVLAGAVATDQGLIQGNADALIRRRAAIDAHVAVLADVDVKHATSLDTRPITARARDLVNRAGADAVLVTGEATGSEPDRKTIAAVQDVLGPTPVLAASGTTPDNVTDMLGCCAGAIVGTALQDPATARITADRAAAYMRAALS
jgi:membrane complex biogenesis BtpA family protein